MASSESRELLQADRKRSRHLSGGRHRVPGRRDPRAGRQRCQGQQEEGNPPPPSARHPQRRRAEQTSAWCDHCPGWRSPQTSRLSFTTLLSFYSGCQHQAPRPPGQRLLIPPNSRSSTWWGSITLVDSRRMKSVVDEKKSLRRVLLRKTRFFQGGY